MEFLFIGFLVIIFLFVAPINVGFNLFYDEKSRKATISLNIFNFLKYLEKKKLAEKKEGKKKSKKLPIKIGLRKNADYKILRLFLPRKLLLELKLPTSLNSAYVYPIIGICDFISDLCDYRNRNFKTAVVSYGESLYFQGKISMQFNLFMIFSAIFQIIKIEFRR